MNKKLSGPWPRFSLSLGVALILACAVAGPAAQKKNSAAPGASVFAQDKGKLTIKLEGQTVGHEEFEITPAAGGWLAKGIADIKPSQSAASKVSGALTLLPNGAPVSYEWTSQAEKTNSANILFANGIAKMTLQMQGAHPFDQTFTFGTPIIAVLDNNLYHQYAVLARLYDWSKRGPQTFPVFIPQELMPGTITAESTGSATLDGKSYEGFRVNTTDLEVDLYLDSNHRMMRLEVPTAKVSVIRD
ncbi:MAG TPA: hypothetical protein VKH63_11385 [Candidatus Acidoferrum sp.]|nr:hypothetical protein [Candidatus Acidoferrum sp.]